MAVTRGGRPRAPRADAKAQGGIESEWTGADRWPEGAADQKALPAWRRLASVAAARRHDVLPRSIGAGAYELVARRHRTARSALRGDLRGRDGEEAVNRFCLITSDARDRRLERPIHAREVPDRESRQRGADARVEVVGQRRQDQRDVALGEPTSRDPVVAGCDNRRVETASRRWRRAGSSSTSRSPRRF